MKNVVGAYLEHKSLPNFMFLITGFDQERAVYKGDLYQGKDTPIQTELPVHVVYAHYVPVQHKYQVGDEFTTQTNPFRQQAALMRIIGYLPSRRYQVVCFIGDTNCGIDAIGDFTIEIMQYIHTNPAPPEVPGCKHEMVDIGVRHTRMVCKLCDHEDKIH